MILSYTGNHYKLILYKNQRIFTFNTLPYAIKDLIVTKCMEKEDGIYNLIPKFKALKASIKGRKCAPTESKNNNKDEGILKPKTDSGVEDIGLPKEEKFDEGLENMKDVKFNEDIVFQFYSKSRDSKPGKGSWRESS